MPDLDSEELDDVLRRRLADYGQEPPPELWASIRQQLPPPVAVPRRRWRRVAGAGLLLTLLLFVVVTVSNWPKRPTQPAPGVATGTTEPTSTRDAAHLQPATSSGKAFSPNGPGPTRTNATPAVASAATTSAPVAGAPSGATPPPAGQAAASTTAGAATAKASAPTTSATGALVPTLAAAHAATPERANNRTLAVVTGSAQVVTVGRARRTKRRGSPLWATANAGRGSISSQPSLRKGAWLQNGLPGSIAPVEQTTAAASASPPDHGQVVSYPPTPASPGAFSAATTAASTTELTANQVGRLATKPRTTAFRQAGSSSIRRSQSDTLGQATSWDLLTARLVPLPLVAGATPATPQPVAVELSPLPAPVLPRWTVQLLAGPALTYRYLGTAPAQASAPAPGLDGIANTVFDPAANTLSTKALVELERPALSGGGHVTIRRALTPHWSLSAGLGYSEYATRLALQQVSNVAAAARFSNNSRSPDSLATAIHRRDSYRFFTIPLRVGYAWTPATRWQVGVLAGADAAFYRGGRSSEGSPCACQTQTWAATGSPYRPFSLGASVGAEVRYHVAVRWELLVQPTATYLLTPLARPNQPYQPRHLFGATALLGVSYELF